MSKQFLGVEKIKTIGSTYMAAAGLHDRYLDDVSAYTIHQCIYLNLMIGSHKQLIAACGVAAATCWKESTSIYTFPTIHLSSHTFNNSQGRIPEFSIVAGACFCNICWWGDLGTALSSLTDYQEVTVM